MSQYKCKTMSCNEQVSFDRDYCKDCSDRFRLLEVLRDNGPVSSTGPFHLDEPLIGQVPPQPVESTRSYDVYETHQKYGIQDPSGCLHQASKNILLSSASKTKEEFFQQIREARDLLNRWIELQHQFV